MAGLPVAICAGTVGERRQDAADESASGCWLGAVVGCCVAWAYRVVVDDPSSGGSFTVVLGVTRRGGVL